jgi:hypothetical protein
MSSSLDKWLWQDRPRRRRARPNADLPKMRQHRAAMAGDQTVKSGICPPAVECGGLPWQEPAATIRREEIEASTRVA